MILLPEFTGISFDSDEDGIANPGEEILLDLTISNILLSSQITLIESWYINQWQNME